MWTAGGVPARTLGFEGGGLGGSHIDWRGERVPTRMLSPEEGENEALFIRVWKPLPSIRVLKTLRGSRKEKAQRGQYR